MPFVAEPNFQHGGPSRTGVLLINLGTPDAPTVPAVRRYLAEFLSDPRVVEIPRLLWWPILHGVILRSRPARSAQRYASIWTDEGSPLLAQSQRVAKRLQGELGQRGRPMTVRLAMRYGNPSVAAGLDALKADGATRILLLPLYPQYAAATTASALDAAAAWSARCRWLPEFRAINHYHDDPGYIAALAASVREHWMRVGPLAAAKAPPPPPEGVSRLGSGPALPRQGKADVLVISFHGLPARSLDLGDPYHCECHKTARLLAGSLGLAEKDYRVTFQSRFGRAKWLQPYTEPSVQALARDGHARIDVVCPGFATDCLETLEEISQEVRNAFIGAGGKEFHYIPCLNDGDRWISALTDLVLRHVQGWDTVAAPTAAAGSASRAKAMGAKA